MSAHRLLILALLLVATAVAEGETITAVTPSYSLQDLIDNGMSLSFGGLVFSNFGLDVIPLKNICAKLSLFIPLLSIWSSRLRPLSERWLWRR